MIRSVGLWDPVKQRMAVTAFVFYAKHIEKHAARAGRLNQFLKDREKEWHVSGTPSG